MKMTIFSLSVVLISGLTQTSCQSMRYFKSFGFAAVNYTSEEMFEAAVKPSLQLRCLHCHNDALANGGLNLQDTGLIYTGDADGPFIVPHNPEASRIWQAIVLPENHPNAMPAQGWGLSDDELRFFLIWIKKGAQWPEGEVGTLELKAS